ncbi:MAG TPA: P1 family peptidase [Vicinamibacterales bacterium]|nr:P1 family peptidase [Vicinamibacterales bacterium]
MSSVVESLQPASGPANSTLTAIAGITVGHHTLTTRPTGCTVILADGGAVGGIAQRGAAPGTRDTDLLQPANGVDRVDAIVLSGGSAFGLDSANGAMRWLDEHSIGWDTGVARVPIVPAAVLIDLWVGGKPEIRPDADCGYRAASNATDAPVDEGSVGAGGGATVGKLLGNDRAMKGGIGTAAIALPNGLQVAALVAVNALGDVADPRTGAVVAGARNADGSLADVRKLLRSGAVLQRLQGGRPGENTTLGVVATNARLTKADAGRVALMADDGYARAVVPAHTIADGDTIFMLATGRWSGTPDVTLIGALAADVMADAVVRAVTQATGVSGIPAVRDIRKP